MKNLCYLLLICILSSCLDPITESDEKKSKNDKSCDLQISVFSQAATTPYPVAIQIYDDNGNKCREQALTADQAQVKLSLPYGNYRLVAISGTSYYKMPLHLNLDSELSYETDNLPLLPLLMGQADIMLASPSATANLQLDNQTSAVTIRATDINPKARSVKVSLSGLYSTITLGGSLENPQPVTLSCHRQDQTWMAGPYYLLPSQKNNTVVSMEVQLPDTTLFYGYNLQYGLQAGDSYQLNLSATSGAIIDHIPPTPVEYTFSVFPVAPCLWDGHVVAMAEKTSDAEGDIWLLSCNEWEDICSAYNDEAPDEATYIAQHYQESGKASGRIAQWSIPSRDEANKLKSLYAGSSAYALNDLLLSAQYPQWSLTDDSGNNVRYLCNEAQHTFTLANSSSGISKAGSKATYRLRLLKKLHVKIEK